MAVKSFGVNSPDAVKLWARKLEVETLNNTDVAPLMGDESNSIIQVKNEFSKNAGDQLSFFLRANLLGMGVDELHPLEGNEEKLNTLGDKLTLGELAHATRVRGAKTITQQRVPYNLRNEATAAITDWAAIRLSEMVFIQLCGYTGEYFNSTQGVKPNVNVLYGFNKPLAPSSDRHVIAGGKSKESDLTDTDTFDITLIDKAVEKAKITSPMLRPVNIQGGNYYVMYLHPTQVTALRTNTDKGQWLDITKSVYSGSAEKNPIMKGMLGMYNGVILRESPNITNGVNNKAGLPNVRRAVLLGAQAAVIGWGMANSGKLKWSIIEELFDYNRELGVSAQTVIGCKKTRYGDEAKSQDFGVITVSTFAKPA